MAPSSSTTSPRHCAAPCASGCCTSWGSPTSRNNRARHPTSFSKTARVPAHATATGKALLAYVPPLALQMIFCQLTRYTPRTLTTPTELTDALHRIRVRGFATADRELDPNTCTVGVPVFDTGGVAIAAIDVQVDSLERSALEEVLPALTTAARCLGREIAPSGGTSAGPSRLPAAR